VAEASVLHDCARLGNPQAAAGRLRDLATVIEGPLIQAQATHATALQAQNPDDADVASEQFQADSANLWRRHGNPRQANRTERRVHDLAARCEGARTPAFSTAAPVRAALSARLREIAHLAASGLSNKDIAERLNISVRTVENKLYTIYERTAVHSRTELSDVLITGPDQP
jgi:DNA-binding NarL/FixJ family response regulator